MAYRYLGAEKFGLWMTMTSFVLFTTFADLGIGNGLTMRIAEANGRNDRAYAVKQISCAFYLLCVIAFLLAVLTMICTGHVNWTRFYGLDSGLISREAGWCTAVLILCTAANMPLGVAPRVQLGYQRGFIPDLWAGLSNIFVLLGSIVAIKLKGSLLLLVLIFGGVPVIAALCNFISEFGFINPGLRPYITAFDLKAGLALAGVGFLFLVQQCFGLIYYASDNIVIAHSLGAMSVAKYAMVQRLFSLGLITQYFVAPLWPAIGEAQARHDFAWAARATRRSLWVGSTFSIAIAVLLLFASRTIIKLWFKVDPGPIDSLRIGFAFWVVIAGYVATANALLNQPKLMRKHLVYFGCASLTSLFLKIMFSKHDVLAGVVWATVLAFGLIYIIPTICIILRNFPEDLRENPCL
jgi:O-antigen/teichoic acid export membrane protein